MIDQGRYRAKAVDWELGVAGTGTEQIAIRFELLDDEQHRTIIYYGYFTDGALKWTLQTLRNCGWEGVDLDDLTGLDSEEVSITVEHEEDQNGEIRAKVGWVNKEGGGPMMTNTIDGKDKKSFAKRMKAKLMALEGGKPKASKPSRAKKKTGTDDELPPEAHADDEDVPY